MADGYGTVCSVAGSFRFPWRTAERHFGVSRRPALGAATISVIPFHPPLSEPLARYDIAPESTLKGDGRDDRRDQRGSASTLSSRPQSGSNPGLSTRNQRVRHCRSGAGRFSVMMRWIVRSSLKSRRLGGRRRRGRAVPRHHPTAGDAPGRLARVRAADGGGPDRSARPVRRGGRAAHHRPAGAGPAQRGAVARRDPLEVGPRAVLDRARSSSPAPTSPGPGRWCKSALTQAVALPHVSKPPQMLQPLSSTSRVMMIGLTSKELSLDRDGRARPLDDQAPPDGRARRGECGDLGPAGAAAAGAGRSGAAATSDGHARAGDRDHRQRAVVLAADAFWRRSTPGTGGFIDTPHQRLGIRHMSADHHAEDLAKVHASTDATGRR